MVKSVLIKFLEKGILNIKSVKILVMLKIILFFINNYFNEYFKCFLGISA